MKNYSHIAEKLFNSPCVITPARHAALCQLVEARMNAPMRVHDDNPDLDGQDDDRREEPEIETKEKGSTVIIPVHGTLVMHPEDIAMSECGCSMDALSAAIDAAENDPRIERVIYDFRTPGGTVTGIPEAARKILHSRKDTIAFTNSECCSGGLWLAAQCQRFYATQSSRVGSCGVYCMSLDYSEAMKKDGIKVNAIFAGKFKLLGAYWKPLSEEEREIMQAGVDKIYGQFKQAMESHRVVDDEHFGNGLVFDGDEAAQIGFTDGVVESMGEILENLVE